MRDDWQPGEFCYKDKVRPVFRRGTGPGVIIIHEVPGITPEVAALGERVADEGFTVVMPSLFGDPWREGKGLYNWLGVGRVCISYEFFSFLPGRTSRVTTWLCALARDLYREVGGLGVGVVGMCFSGGFALAMMLDKTVLVPVMSQPSLPFGPLRAQKRDLGLDPGDLTRICARVQTEDLCVQGLRFTSDYRVPAERFRRLRSEFGPNFDCIEITSGPDSQNRIGRKAHSVLTTEPRRHHPDSPAGRELEDAAQRVLELLRNRLHNPNRDL
jgi:dienelactone hydrolase